MARLSGPAIKPLAAAARLVTALTIPVIGIGGIASNDGAREFLELGARAVQIGTANFYLPGIAVSRRRSAQLGRGIRLTTARWPVTAPAQGVDLE